MLTRGSAAGATASPLRAFARRAGFRADLDAALAAPVERGDVVGVIGAVTDAGDTLYSAAFGKREIGRDVAMTEETVCNIASMVKPVTAVCALQLVEQGRLDLDAPIATWLPDAGQLQVLAGWQGDRPVLRAPARPITLRHLMTHSSGMSSTLWDAGYLKFVQAVHRGGDFPPLDYADPATWIGRPLMFDPGEKWAYGPSLDWIGRLVQDVSGKSLGTYMRENVLAPLGMASTGFAMSEDMLARRATIHQRAPDGTIGLLDPPVPVNDGREYGGGTINGTATDYQRFIRMILNGGSGNGNRVLRPETVARMVVNQMGGVRVPRFLTTSPARMRDIELFPGVPKSWGMSFMINEAAAPTGRPAGSLAWAGAYNTFFWIDPVNRIGGVFLSQLKPLFDEKTMAAFSAFESACYGNAA